MGQGKRRAWGRWCGIAVLAAGCLSQAAIGETLKETLTKTYQNNPDLAAEQAHVREVDEGVAKANSAWRPSLALEAEYERTTEKTKTDAGKFNLRSQTWSADLVATQPLFTGGRNGSLKRLALAKVDAARARLRIKEQRVLLEAVTAHVDAARNETVLELVRADITLLQALLKETTERRDAKKATDSDVDQVTAALEAARASCLQTLAAVNDSLRAYEQIVGEAPAMVGPAGDAPRINPCVDARGERVHSVLDLPVDLVAAPGSLEEVEKAAQGSVPDLDEVRAEEEVSRQEVSAAYAELMPQASITARAGTSAETFDPQWKTHDASVSAELSVPIFNTGAEWAEIRAAREANSRARLNITSRQRQIMRDALHAWYDLVSIRAVRSVNKDQANTVLRAFEGLRKEMADAKLHRSVTDLLGLRALHLAARTLLVNSQRDEAVAIYKLMAATGNLNAAFLELPVQPYDPAANLKSQRGRWVGDSIQGE